MRFRNGIVLWILPRCFFFCVTRHPRRHFSLFSLSIQYSVVQQYNINSIYSISASCSKSTVCIFSTPLFSALRHSLVVLHLKYTQSHVSLYVVVPLKTASVTPSREFPCLLAVRRTYSPKTPRNACDTNISSTGSKRPS